MFSDSVKQLANVFVNHGPAVVLTGAGCSTNSGIPDYRDRDGEWKARPPVMFDDFIRHEEVRRRYWAGSMNGWRRIERAQPNPGHHCLAELEDNGFIHTLITQNVDGLHQKAGNRNIIDLHGRLATVICLHCGIRLPRQSIQAALLESNREFFQDSPDLAPDGDALTGDGDLSAFTVPACPDCRGILKPDVVFFGEAVPADRTAACLEALGSAGCLLVVGSSLMVYSGYRYCREALKRKIPVVIINYGRTRADNITDFKINADCCEVLTALMRLLPAANRPQEYA